MASAHFTLNNIKDLLDLYVQNNLDIKRFGFGVIPDIEELIQQSEQFPLLWVNPVQITYPADNVKEYRMNIVLMDYLDNAKNNEVDIWSDSSQQLEDLQKFLTYNAQNYYNVVDVRQYTFTEGKTEFVAGATMEIAFQVDFESNDCGIDELGFNFSMPAFLASATTSDFDCDSLTNCPIIQDIQTDINILFNLTGSTGHFLPLSGGTVSGNTNFSNGAIISSGGTNLYDIFQQNQDGDFVIRVRVTTTTILPGLPIYSNGAAGVGATLTRGSNGALTTIDGITLIVGDRICVKNQASQLQNGVYEVTSVGSAGSPYVLTRTTDSDTSDELDSLIISASEGTVNNGLLFAQITNTPIIGTNNIVWVQTTNNLYVTQQVSGTQINGQVPWWNNVTRQLTKGVGRFRYDDLSNSLLIQNFNSTGTGTTAFLRVLSATTDNNINQFLTVDSNGYIHQRNISGITSGITATPAPPNTAVQFNDNGVFGGNSGFTFDKSNNSFVVAISSNINSASTYSTIIGGGLSNIYNSSVGLIAGGAYGLIANSNIASIISSIGAVVSGSNSSSIIDSSYSNISGVYNSSIISSYYSLLSGSSTSIINGGHSHTINYTLRSAILGGKGHFINGDKQTAIIGGTASIIGFSCDSIIGGGSFNSIYSSHRSAIIGGSNLTLSGENDIVFVPQLRISTATTDNTLVSLLGRDINGDVKERNLSSISGSGIPGGYITNIQFNDGGIFGGSSAFTFDKNFHNITLNGFGVGNTIANNTYSSAILGGGANTIVSGQGNSIISGAFNSINNGADFSTVIAGFGSYIIGAGIGVSSRGNSVISAAASSILDSSTYSSIIGGGVNTLSASTGSTIIGASYSNINTSINSNIIGADRSCISNSYISSINSSFGSNLSDSYVSSIFAGVVNKINDSKFSVSIGGISNSISGCNISSIINSYRSSILCSSISSINSSYRSNISCSNRSIIIGGSGISVTGSTNSSSIVGKLNSIHISQQSTIEGGENNIISSSTNSSIVGGSGNTIDKTTTVPVWDSIHSSIIGGVNNTLDNATNSAIGAGRNNFINFGFNDSIIGGEENIITNSYNSSLVAGCKNKITYTTDVTVIGGSCNYIFNASTFGSIIGGAKNTIKDSSTYSSIIGGKNNIISSSTYSSIIGGNNLSLINENNLVLVPQLRIATATTDNSLTTLLGRDIDGNVNEISISSLVSTGAFLPLSGGTVSGTTNFNNGSQIQSGGTNLYNIFATSTSADIVRVQNGLNTYTGGTDNFPTVNISAATLTSLSSTSISGGTIYSGSTNLSSIFALASANAPSWSLTGNTGTNSSTNFIGTIDNVDLMFRRSNLQAGIITATNVGFGEQALANNTGLTVVGIGKKAASGNTGFGISAIGYKSAYSNRGHDVNSMGNSSARYNTGNYVNAFGIGAADGNKGNDVNAIGWTATAADNIGNRVNAIGNFAAFCNSGSCVNAIGYRSALQNSGGHVNAMGKNASYLNTGSHIIGFGYSATKGNTGSCVIGIGNNAAVNNTFSNTVIIGNSATASTNNQFAISPSITTLNLPLNSHTTGSILTSDGTGIGTWKSAFSGSAIYIMSGSNATIGTVVLTGGTATVNTTKATNSAVILLTVQGGTITNVGSTYVTSRVNATSFTIASTNILDSSTIGWVIFEQI